MVGLIEQNYGNLNNRMTLSLVQKKNSKRDSNYQFSLIKSSNGLKYEVEHNVATMIKLKSRVEQTTDNEIVHKKHFNDIVGPPVISVEAHRLNG